MGAETVMGTEKGRDREGVRRRDSGRKTGTGTGAGMGVERRREREGEGGGGKEEEISVIRHTRKNAE